MITGHGCFNDFLHRIGKARSKDCSFCEAPCDSNLHTLGGCQAWERERQVLVSAIGGDMSLGAVVAAILKSRENWIAFGKFCEHVMLRKEEAEWERQAEAHGAEFGWRIRRRRMSDIQP
ncbi:PREDICTED: uncharacterized protein LOC105448609 [Wasmannia auropunctata]|uniref:uncharacterized protein LOC105448609 n=1 Tax=Wasmannia auropunctata TaxID=64793 RepID=UPI0005EFB8DE|nr:PREDICTED: uncharacterized protein LOC105448609 [Wasmannia auropunctata]